MLTNELDAAVTLARKAGVAVLEHYAREIVSESKMGIDERFEPVTVADREASRIIVDGLATLFPHDGILSEEEADEIEARLTHERVWVIDPIDGTAGFIKKDGDFAVQIGLSIAGLPELGVVYLPAHGTLYFAAKGRGAFVETNGRAPQKLQVSSEDRFP